MIHYMTGDMLDCVREDAVIVNPICLHEWHESPVAHRIAESFPIIGSQCREIAFNYSGLEEYAEGNTEWEEVSYTESEVDVGAVENLIICTAIVSISDEIRSYDPIDLMCVSIKDATVNPEHAKIHIPREQICPKNGRLSWEAVKAIIDHRLPGYNIYIWGDSE